MSIGGIATPVAETAAHSVTSCPRSSDVIPPTCFRPTGATIFIQKNAVNMLINEI